MAKRTPHRRIRNMPEKKEDFRKNPNARSVQRHLSFTQRRSSRQAKLGELTEERVDALLAEKKEAKDLISFERHPHNSPEDEKGNDFTVTVDVNGKLVTVSFGVTCSNGSHQKHRLMHPGVPSIVIPPEMSDKRIWERIVMLAKERLEP